MTMLEHERQLCNVFCAICSGGAGHIPLIPICFAPETLLRAARQGVPPEVEGTPRGVHGLSFEG